MVDDLAARSYRAEVARRTAQARRAVTAVRGHLDVVARWLDDPHDAALPALSLGTDVAELLAAAGEVKALREIVYLVDDVPGTR